MRWPSVNAIAVAGWLICSLASAASAANNPESPISSGINIYGHPYSLELKENTELARQLSGVPSATDGRKLRFADWQSVPATHYQGRLSDREDSWVRLSEVDGQWQGIVSLAREIYLVKSVDGVLIAEPASSFQPVACGCGPSRPGQAKVLLDPNIHSALEMPSEVAFSSLCATNIDGVCLLAEVEFVFDTLFQNEFGANARAQAESLINMAEGFYRNDFNIIFDTITLELLSSDVFSDTTDSGDLLDDIQIKKRNNQLSFVQNNRALLHLVTGRNFDGNTAGVAFVDALCNRFGFSAGTSQLLRNFNGSPNMSLTALVVAHELGHNFGADHDGEGNSCDDSSFIMAPSVNSSISQFSSCSISTMQEAISALTAPELCFNFPVDISIVADASNPQSATAGNEITLQYDVGVREAFRAVPTVQVSGSVPAGEGRINSAELNGQPCTVSGDGLSYQCSLNNPLSDMSLQVSVVANTDGVNLPSRWQWREITTLLILIPLMIRW